MLSGSAKWCERPWDYLKALMSPEPSWSFHTPTARRLPGTPGDDAKRILLAFYEALLDNSGMQLSAPPGKDGAMAGEWEKNLLSVVYYHGRNTPPPPMAGSQFGRAPLPAAKVSWNGTLWKVEDSRVAVAEAMHLANELNWLGPHLGSVPFPKVSKEAGAYGS